MHWLPEVSLFLFVHYILTTDKQMAVVINLVVGSEYCSTLTNTIYAV